MEFPQIQRYEGFGVEKEEGHASTRVWFERVRKEEK